MAFLKRSKKDPFTQIQTCLQKRDYKGALVWFKPLLTKDSKNTQVRLRYADTLVLAGSKREAIKQYRVVADELAESGFMIRAIAINKKIVQLDPAQSDVHEKLAAMNEERSRAASTKSALPLQMSTPAALPEEAAGDPHAEAFGMEEVGIEDMGMEPVGEAEIGIEKIGVEKAPPLDEVAPSDREDPPSEPTLSLDESMAMEFGGTLREQPSAGTPSVDEEPAPVEEVMDINLGGVEDEPEPRGFELEAEEEPEFQVSAPSFEAPSESFEIEPSAVEFDLADEGGAPAGEEPFLQAEEPSLGATEEAPSFVEEPVAVIESRDLPAEPEEELVLMFDEESEAVEEPEAELQLESEGELEPEPELQLEPEVAEEVGDELEWETDSEEESEPGFLLVSEGEEMELDIETEPEMAADGKDALVGLLGEDIDSMIDSIIDDVGSSISGTPSKAPKAATRIPLFSDLTAEEFVDVAIMLVRRTERAGTVIVKEGAPGDSMFIVSTGEVEATRDQDGEAVKLATLRDGDFFGEIAVLSGESRTATVTANKNTELLELSRSDLNVICSRHPDVEAKLRLAYDERSMSNG